MEATPPGLVTLVRLLARGAAKEAFALQTSKQPKAPVKTPPVPRKEETHAADHRS